jgi:peptidoglycan/xylan/chitin deacetylase (PgdA/CDA1 family)
MDIVSSPMRIFGFFLALTLLLAIPPKAQAGIPLPEDESSAVILAYYRIGEDAYPDSSLRADQFEAQIDEFITAGYKILPLPEIVNALKNGEALPPRAIAITFEGAYQSAYKNAMPLLLEKNIPFTVFFSSSQADIPAHEHMGWAELRSLRAHDTVTLGILPATYMRLGDQPREEVLARINKARIRFRENFKSEPAFFSYPYGEYSESLKALIREQGFAAAFGLQSGSAYSDSDFMALPRFTMTEKYGDMERFRLVAGALPLPVEDIEPADAQIDTENPVIGFTVTDRLAPYLKSLACHVSGQDQPAVEILSDTRIELRLAEPVSEERTRVNCTLPGPREPDGTLSHWRWMGMLLFNKAHITQEINPQQTALP